MGKIKDIHDRLIKDPGEYSEFTFLVAERIFLVVCGLYFTSVLATVGGFYFSWLSLKSLSMISFHLYSLLVLSIVWFGFSWSERLVFIHFPGKRWISFAILIILMLIGGVGLYAHIAPIFS